jgi:hypothetical protein
MILPGVARGRAAQSKWTLWVMFFAVRAVRDILRRRERVAAIGRQDWNFQSWRPCGATCGGSRRYPVVDRPRPTREAMKARQRLLLSAIRHPLPFLLAHTS